mmetsp:Transcript_20334/g.58372  ORF Transcript_20334/g.58372 Transcript_20334/m.58372 type:complete len:693 (+) Transcript_20334:48-2126(+)|eukprot:CAMPEP_0181060998 /NCGR_PEP_ID=MMETSP1070-20121207/22280_1 /TAXON_ID=265543 /ORGANISM="Minutocellus polymorphus, Strain NH13" /LENGTH=692 /DNA_ID=CAMNT_0023140911 /DNA_START=40 /DNA_END=2118 /DNA_ORIENTATION=+
MTPPSDLLAAFVDAKAGSSRGEKSDEDHSEEVLIATLSSCRDLADLSPSSSAFGQGTLPTPSIGFSREQSCCSSILGSALFDGIEIRDGDGDAGGDGQEWSACIRLLRLILGLPDSVGDKASKRSEVPPHIVMRTVMDHSLDSFDYDGGDEENMDTCDPCDRESVSCSACSIDTKSILLMLLSSASVRLTASDIRQTLASSTDSKIRWRRASSVAMECIGLYQRLVLERLGGSLLSTSEDTCLALIDATTLLGTYVAGAIYDLLSMFRKHNSAAPAEKIEAGLISATSMTARFVNTVMARQNPMLSQQLCLDLVRYCIAPLGSIQLDIILLSPLRQWEYDRVGSIGDVDDSSEDEESDTITFTNAHSPGDMMFAEMVCGNSSTDNPGGMKTHWDNAGIALLVYHILVDRTTLPSVYSPEFYYAMLYPHSGALLHLAQNVDEELDSELRFAIISNGIELLSLTLDLSNSCGPTNGSMPYARLCRDVESPLGPVGTVQLLLNTAVALSDTSGDQNNINVSKPKILGLIRKLFHCYPSLQHVRSVASLLQRCPFDYLEPVLLDLLRPALLIAAETTKIKDDGVEDETLELLESVLGEMKSHVTVDDGDVRLIDIDGLMSRVEQYTCAVSLVRLLLIRREVGGRTRLDSAVATLIDFYVGLCNILEDATNADLFQLHLLLDALGELERQSASTSRS